MKIVKKEEYAEYHIESIIKRIGLRKASAICGKSVSFLSDCMRGYRKMNYWDWKKFRESKEWGK